MKELEQVHISKRTIRDQWWNKSNPQHIEPIGSTTVSNSRDEAWLNKHRSEIGKNVKPRTWLNALRRRG